MTLPLPLDRMVVVKHNDLIDAAQRLSVIESRIVLTCISRINSKEVLDPSVKFSLSVQDISDLIGISPNSGYDNLKLAVDRLAERWVILLRPSKRVFERKIRWVSEVAYIPSEGKIELFFTPSISKLLSNVTRDFTQYKLENVLGFTCIYSIRLYELFKRWGGTGKDVGLDELHGLLELEGKYERWTNFKTFVLLPAIKDINETSDVQVSWKPFTSGIRVGGIVFAYTLPKKGHTLLPKKVITQKKAPIAETIEAGVDPLKEWANMRKRFGDMPGVPAEIELQLKAKGWW